MHLFSAFIDLLVYVSISDNFLEFDLPRTKSGGKTCNSQIYVSHDLVRLHDKGLNIRDFCETFKIMPIYARFLLIFQLFSLSRLRDQVLLFSSIYFVRHLKAVVIVVDLGLPKNNNTCNATMMK